MLVLNKYQRQLDEAVNSLKQSHLMSRKEKSYWLKLKAEAESKINQHQ